ncbi:hypothetical protein FQA47_015729 [Oryzias melastigma]|uniref:Uncharacterized protein n=1 Tax=Oryzias melastigma TaxID=30732 RepID=A0A834CA25_ORYME|nr:hypothetical protein FQA47_015729 [Oryzias melastigma]
MINRGGGGGGCPNLIWSGPDVPSRLHCVGLHQLLRFTNSPSQQLGKDFRANHREDGGGHRTGNITRARRQQQQQRRRDSPGLDSRLSACFVTELLQGERVATSDRRKGTQHCARWSDTCTPAESVQTRGTV